MKMKNLTKIKIKELWTIALCFVFMASAFMFSNINAFAATNVSTWSDLKNKIESQSSGSNVTYKITSTLTATNTITIPKGAIVYLECGVSDSDHTSTSADIVRGSNNHGHLFKIDGGGTLYLNCCVSGGSGTLNNSIANIGTRYGYALIYNNGNFVMEKEKSILKYNYNKLSVAGDWTYDGKKYSVETYDAKNATDRIGAAGAAIYNKNGNVTIENGQIYNCVSDNGPAIYSSTDDSKSATGYYKRIRIKGGIIHTNVARRYGGAIFAGSAEILRDTVEPSVNIEGGKIHTNVARTNGGGIWTGFGASLKISGGEIYSNKAVEGFGGGIRCNGGSETDPANSDMYLPGGNTLITGGSIHDNNAATNGGGIVSSVDTLKRGSACNININDGTIYNNNAATGNGGGIYIGANCTSSISLEDNKIYPKIYPEIYSNKAANNGGGIYYAGTRKSVDINKCNIHDNIAENNGGGMYFVSGNTISLDNNFTLIYRNNANNNGGGIATNTETNISKGQIFSNTATNNGGGIYVGTNGKVNLTGGIIHSNKAQYGAGMYFTTEGPASTLSGGSIYSNIATSKGGGVVSHRTNGLTISDGFYYDNTNWGVYAGDKSKLTITGGKYGVSDYTDWKTYTVSRNDIGNVYIGNDTNCNINNNNYPRFISEIDPSKEESFGNNISLQNKGTTTITGNVSFLGSGSAIINDESLTFNGSQNSIPVIQAQENDGQKTSLNARGIYNSANGTITINKLTIRFCKNYGIVNYGNLTVNDIVVQENGVGIYSGGTKSNTTINNGLFYGNDWAVKAMNTTGNSDANNKIIINGGKYGVSSYTSWSDYEVSRNTSGNVYIDNGVNCQIDGTTNQINDNNYPRFISEIDPSENIDDNVSLQNKGTTTITGNVQFYGKGSAIINDGTLTLNEDENNNNEDNCPTIQTSDKDTTYALQKRRGIYNSNNGTLTINATYISRCNSRGIYNDGTTYINGGSICYNTTPSDGENGGGIYNNGSLSLTGGNISLNTAIKGKGDGIYNTNKGKISMSGTAIVNASDTIYLAGNTFIQVPTAFTGYQNIRAYVDGDNFETGRVIAKFSGMTTASGKYALYWTPTDPKMTEQYFAVHEKILRTGDQGASNNTDNINKQDVFISEEYKVCVTDTDSINDEIYYPNSIDSNDPVQIHNQTVLVDTKYWNENKEYTLQKAYTNTDPKEYCTGWKEKTGSNDTVYRNDTTIAIDENRNYTFYAVWNGRVLINILFNGNTNTDSVNINPSEITATTHCEICDKNIATEYRKKDVSTRKGYTVEKNKFKKQYKSFKNAKQHKEDVIEYAPIGWSIDPNSKGINDPYLLKFDQELTAKKWADYIKQVDAYISEDDTLTLYCIWDGVPYITASDVFYTFKEARAGAVRYDELFVLSVAEATDSVRGDYTNFSNEGLFEIYSYKDLKGNDHILKEEGNNIQAFFQSIKESDYHEDVYELSIPVTFYCKDKAGNTSFKTINVIVRKDRVPEDKIYFTRFISSKYYKDSDGNYIDELNGGLNDNSRWRTKQPYIELIERVFSNVFNTDRNEWENVVQTYSFTNDKLKEAQAYVEDNGIGNLNDKNALKKFSSLYKQ